MAVEQFFILDQTEKPVAVIMSDEFFKVIHNERITGENTLDFQVPADIANEKAQYILEGNFIAYYDDDDDFQMFEIVKLTEEDIDGEVYKTAYCEHNFYELLDNVVEDKRAVQSNAIDAIDDALTGSRWNVGDVDYFGIRNSNVYYKNSLEALADIRDRFTYTDVDAKTAKGKYTFRIVVDPDDWSMTRYVDFERQTGVYGGKRFVAGKDLSKFTREVDSSELYTAVYARGKGEEIQNDNLDESVTPNSGDTTYGRRLTIGVSKQFTSGLKWTKSNTPLPNQDWTEGILPWQTEAHAGITYSTVDDTDGKTADGGRALKIYKTTTSDRAMVTSDFVGVTVGEEYSVRFLANCSAVTQIEFYIDWYTAAEAFISSSNSIPFYDILTEHTGIWKLIETTGTAPATATKAKMRFIFRAAYAGTFYVDRCRFGHYTTKPALQEWLEDVDAKIKWGRAGGTINRIGIYENDDVTDASVLAQLAFQYLQDHKEPIVSYECSVEDISTLEGYEHEKARMGDLVLVIDENFYTIIQLSARVVGLKRDLLLPENTEIELSNFIKDLQDINKRQADLEKKVSNRVSTWDSGTAFEQLSDTSRRIRMDLAESGEFQSIIRYETDEGVMVGYASSERFSYNKIQSDQFIGQNIITTNTAALTLYVDSYAGDDLNDGLTAGTAFKTLGRLDGEAAIPKILRFPVIVHVLDSHPSGEGNAPYNEHASIDGILGGELLEITWDAGVILNGSLRFRSCTAPIWCHGYGTGTSPMQYATVAATQAGYPPLSTYNCRKIRFQHMWANAADLAHDAVRCDASNTLVYRCVAEKASVTGYAAIHSHDTAQVLVDECKGSGNYDGVYATTASYAGLLTTRPQGNTGLAKRADNSSTIVDTGTATGTASPVASSNPTGQSTLECLCSQTDSWQFDYGRWRPDNNRVYQGRYTTGYPLHAGIMLFNGTNKFSALSGKTIKSAKLYIKRLSGGGNSAAQQIHLWGCTSLTLPTTFTTSLISAYDYSYVASLKWGEELAIDLPQDFLDDVNAGSINSLVLYEADGSPYVICEDVASYQIKVVFQYNP